MKKKFHYQELLIERIPKNYICSQVMGKCFIDSKGNYESPKWFYPSVFQKNKRTTRRDWNKNKQWISIKGKPKRIFENKKEIEYNFGFYFKNKNYKI